MKFAKELEQDLVPEWRVKYLDYKQGKKKLKAVARAIKNADKSPTVPGKKRHAPFSTSPFRTAPVYNFITRTDNRIASGLDANVGANSREWPPSTPADGPDPDATPRASPHDVQGSDERQPLRGVASNNRAYRQGMTRYGSIIGSPAREGEEESPIMWRLRHEASSLELPDPALDPGRSRESIERDYDYDRSISRGHAETLPKPPPSIPSQQPSAFEVGKPAHAPTHFSLAPRLRSIFQQRRGNSMSAATGESRPLGKRMLTFAGVPSPQQRADVELQAAREVDIKQAEFFLLLDKQLEKIEDFYKMKEDQATDRLQELRQQLHIMRDRRLEEVLAAEVAKNNHRSNANANGKLSTQLGGALLDGVVEPNGDTDSRPANRQSSRMPGIPWLPSISQAADNLKNGPVGKTSKAMEELGTPPGAQPHDDGQNRDYSRRPLSKEMPYRTAKRRLKIALAEYYRGLELLKSYALMNRTAFRKINKKFDKTVNARPSGRYMSEKVNKAYFVNSDVLEGHIQAVEDLYARYFERGNRKIAVGKLRAKIARSGDFTPSVFRDGVLLAAGAVFGVQGLTYGAELLLSDDPVRQVQTSYLLQIYAGYFLMVLLLGLFTIACRAFVIAKVNYAFIFEFDTRHHLDWRQLAEFPSLFLFLLGLTLWLNFSIFGGEALFIYWPVILIGVTLLLYCNPIPIFYQRSRSWFLYSMFRLNLAGLFPVEFRDFFLGDMFCSLTYLTGNISLFFCLYSHHWNDPPQCNSSHSRLMGFFSALPGIWRLLQCLRRYRDTRKWFPHLVNGGKYTATIISYMSLSLYRIDKSPHFKALFILCSIVNSLYTSFWDVIMDWSLGDPYAKHKLLRQTLAYKHVWWYYAAMVVDPILRFNWILYAIYTEDLQHSTLVSFLVAFSEILRRGMWTLFRVENEHCTNVGRFRASRDIPLPYEVSPPPSRSSTATSKKPSSELHRTPPTLRGQAQTEPSLLSQHTSRTTAADIERPSPSAAESLRRRISQSTESPISRAMSRVGTIMHTAHAEDFQRKKRPEASNDVAEESDEDNEQSSDDEDEAPKNSGNSRRPVRARGGRRGSATGGDELGRVETAGEERSVIEISSAEDALERAGHNNYRS